MTTRATFYQRKNGGGTRTARTSFTCAQFGCFKKILPGEVFFDTQEVTTWPAKKRICLACSEAKL